MKTVASLIEEYYSNPSINIFPGFQKLYIRLKQEHSCDVQVVRVIARQLEVIFLSSRGMDSRIVSDWLIVFARFLRQIWQQSSLEILPIIKGCIEDASFSSSLLTQEFVLVMHRMNGGSRASLLVYLKKNTEEWADILSSPEAAQPSMPMTCYYTPAADRFGQYKFQCNGKLIELFRFIEQQKNIDRVDLYAACMPLIAQLIGTLEKSEELTPDIISQLPQMYVNYFKMLFRLFGDRNAPYQRRKIKEYMGRIAAIWDGECIVLAKVCWKHAFKTVLIYKGLDRPGLIDGAIENVIRKGVSKDNFLEAVCSPEDQAENFSPLQWDRICLLAKGLSESSQDAARSSNSAKRNSYERESVRTQLSRQSQVSSMGPGVSAVPTHLGRRSSTGSGHGSYIEEDLGIVHAGIEDPVIARAGIIDEIRLSQQRGNTFSAAVLELAQKKTASPATLLHLLEIYHKEGRGKAPPHNLNTEFFSALIPQDIAKSSVVCMQTAIKTHTKEFVELFARSPAHVLTLDVFRYLIVALHNKAKKWLRWRCDGATIKAILDLLVLTLIRDTLKQFPRLLGMLKSCLQKPSEEQQEANRSHQAMLCQLHHAELTRYNATCSLQHKQIYTSVKIIFKHMLSVLDDYKRIELASHDAHSTSGVSAIIGALLPILLWSDGLRIELANIMAVEHHSRKEMDYERIFSFFMVFVTRLVEIAKVSQTKFTQSKFAGQSIATKLDENIKLLSTLKGIDHFLGLIGLLLSDEAVGSVFLKVAKFDDFKEGYPREFSDRIFENTGQAMICLFEKLSNVYRMIFLNIQLVKVSVLNISMDNDPCVAFEGRGDFDDNFLYLRHIEQRLWDDLRSYQVGLSLKYKTSESLRNLIIKAVETLIQSAPQPFKVLLARGRRSIDEELKECCDPDETEESHIKYLTKYAYDLITLQGLISSNPSACLAAMSKKGFFAQLQVLVKGPAPAVPPVSESFDPFCQLNKMIKGGSTASQLSRSSFDESPHQEASVVQPKKPFDVIGDVKTFLAQNLTGQLRKFWHLNIGSLATKYVKGRCLTTLRQNAIDYLVVNYQMKLPFRERPDNRTGHVRNLFYLRQKFFWLLLDRLLSNTKSSDEVTFLGAEHRRVVYTKCLSDDDIDALLFLACVLQQFSLELDPEFSEWQQALDKWKRINSLISSFAAPSQKRCVSLRKPRISDGNGAESSAARPTGSVAKKAMVRSSMCTSLQEFIAIDQCIILCRDLFEQCVTIYNAVVTRLMSPGSCRAQNADDFFEIVDSLLDENKQVFLQLGFIDLSGLCNLPDYCIAVSKLYSLRLVLTLETFCRLETAFDAVSAALPSISTITRDQNQTVSKQEWGIVAAHAHMYFPAGVYRLEKAKEIANPFLQPKTLDAHIGKAIQGDNGFQANMTDLCRPHLLDALWFQMKRDSNGKIEDLLGRMCVQMIDRNGGSNEPFEQMGFSGAARHSDEQIKNANQGLVQTNTGTIEYKIFFCIQKMLFFQWQLMRKFVGEDPCAFPQSSFIFPFYSSAFIYKGFEEAGIEALGAYKDLRKMAQQRQNKDNLASCLQEIRLLIVCSLYDNRLAHQVLDWEAQSAHDISTKLQNFRQEFPIWELVNKVAKLTVPINIRQVRATLALYETHFEDSDVIAILLRVTLQYSAHIQFRRGEHIVVWANQFKEKFVEKVEPSDTSLQIAFKWCKSVGGMSLVNQLLFFERSDIDILAIDNFYYQTVGSAIDKVGALVACLIQKYFSGEHPVWYKAFHGYVRRLLHLARKLEDSLKENAAKLEDSLKENFDRLPAPIPSRPGSTEQLSLRPVSFRSINFARVYTCFSLAVRAISENSFQRVYPSMTIKLREQLELPRETEALVWQKAAQYLKVMQGEKFTAETYEDAPDVIELATTISENPGAFVENPGDFLVTWRVRSSAADAPAMSESCATTFGGLRTRVSPAPSPMQLSALTPDDAAPDPARARPS